ncbi:glycosyltransferase family 1 protein [Diaminobutyricimonas sp. TR449]|uniref:glycosyltransferase family 4 protein n=1 Tax=Diaminobutyricimonas sp. TR449 TaxID=2708076 RepID=UPI00141FE29F|nr:glycosyltransferase family 1 protein [Diaminobutyricimonas sp. TR449]
MRIVIDCRYIRLGQHDGISRYTAGIVTALLKLHPVTMLISDERQLEMLPDAPWHRVSAPTSIHEPFLARQVNPLKPDVVFTPMQTMGSFGRQYRFVNTIHDLIYYSHPTPPRNLPWPVRVLWRLYHLSWWPQRFLLNRADAVVTVSQTTKELIRRHRLTKRDVTVVYNAADPVLAVRREQPAERDLLYMGSFMPYKNVETLALAMQHLPGYRLHLLSRASDADRARLGALAPAGSLVFHGGVSDEEYHDLLRGAFALVHASRDEGFGIPLVEAMAHGTPIVVSDIPIFTEIGGEAAGFFRPDSAEDAAAAVRALEDSAEWSRRSALAHEQAGRFDWDRSAAVLYDLLRRFAGS